MIEGVKTKLRRFGMAGLGGGRDEQQGATPTFSAVGLLLPAWSTVYGVRGPENMQ